MLKKIEYCEIIKDQKVESCALIEDRDAKIIEYCEIIEDQKVESCELIEDGNAKIIVYCQIIYEKFSKNSLKQEEIKKLKSIIIEHKKNEGINMLRLSTDELKKLNPLKKELKVIAGERGIKNYKNLSKSKLMK